MATIAPPFPSLSSSLLVSVTPTMNTTASTSAIYTSSSAQPPTTTSESTYIEPTTTTTPVISTFSEVIPTTSSYDPTTTNAVITPTYTPTTSFTSTYVTSTVRPTVVPTEVPSHNSSSGPISTGGIVGIVIGGVFLLVALALVASALIRRSRRRRHEAYDNNNSHRSNQASMQQTYRPDRRGGDARVGLGVVNAGSNNQRNGGGMSTRASQDLMNASSIDASRYSERANDLGADASLGTGIYGYEADGRPWHQQQAYYPTEPAPDGRYDSTNVAPRDHGVAYMQYQQQQQAHFPAEYGQQPIAPPTGTYYDPGDYPASNYNNYYTDLAYANQPYVGQYYADQHYAGQRYADQGYTQQGLTGPYYTDQAPPGQQFSEEDQVRYLQGLEYGYDLSTRRTPGPSLTASPSFAGPAAGEGVAQNSPPLQRAYATNARTNESLPNTNANATTITTAYVDPESGTRSIQNKPRLKSPLPSSARDDSTVMATPAATVIGAQSNISGDRMLATSASDPQPQSRSPLLSPLRKRGPQVPYSEDEPSTQIKVERDE
ncbi:hypothetical protein BC939DRAFT_451423 [Gamsiella multidivaricata]|uniref:uncharacterized protein n=1 Tax=Gamsiella multidivaricata TaxID=101098 RepID=UPI0022200CCA|nr:uncharacterized protein BC939DRAFT_451423 [Gamsiella multidivaricata]KAG0370967.1 hypothetical protein BGZ54_002114 [Gamsiella multidivaricata]KAI7823584.1 hypothetical protein BC939DRAFT_451423 [Gamsiella multidivaricata]